MLTERQFLSSLRHVLRHLYDPPALHRRRFARFVKASGTREAVSATGSLVTRAIASLKPSSDIPLESRLWRLYEVLLYRYVHQCTQQEVADQLGLSIRQLRREEAKASEVLAQRLIERLGLEIEPSPADEPQSDDEAEEAPEVTESLPSALNDELMWLTKAPLGEQVHLEEVLPPVIQLVRAMIQSHGVSLAVNAPQNTSALAVSGVVLRQILLSVLSTAIRLSAGGRVSLDAAEQEWEIDISVWGSGPNKRVELSPNDTASLEMACRLAQSCGGDVRTADAGKPFHADVTLPTLERLPVLVIDDNADALRLMQRYATGTRYRVQAARDWQQALAIARETPPQIIVLDVMMPDVDGWDLMGRLQQHPLTSHVPIIVCSILAQKELAQSLGARDYVRKPITPESFVGALDRQAHSTERVSR